MAKIVHDEEFGDISVRHHRGATRLALRIAPNGAIYISAPYRTSGITLAIFLRSSRRQIRELIARYRHTYTASQSIGKSHSLVIQPGASTNVSLEGTKIVATIGTVDDIASEHIQQIIRTHILKALRKEARGYLPRRLSYIATEHSFSYGSIRFTHSSSRWGSCSSKGAISLNIALMNLPFELIDYVLVHELCHTKHMNHSSVFWKEVATIVPDYKIRRNALKQHTPHI